MDAATQLGSERRSTFQFGSASFTAFQLGSAPFTGFQLERVSGDDDMMAAPAAAAPGRTNASSPKDIAR